MNSLVNLCHFKFDCQVGYKSPNVLRNMSMCQQSCFAKNETYHAKHKNFPLRSFTFASLRTRRDLKVEYELFCSLQTFLNFMISENLLLPQLFLVLASSPRLRNLYPSCKNIYVRKGVTILQNIMQTFLMRQLHVPALRAYNCRVVGSNNLKKLAGYLNKFCSLFLFEYPRRIRKSRRCLELADI